MLEKRKNSGITRVALIIIISTLIVLVAIATVVIVTILNKDKTEESNQNVIGNDDNTRVNVGGVWYNSMDEYLAEGVSNKQKPEIYEYSFDIGYKNGKVTSDVVAYVVKIEGKTNQNGEPLYSMMCIGEGSIAPISKWNTNIVTVNSQSENTIVNYNISIKNIKISEGVTSIPDYAFYGASELSNIEIPNTIEMIGENAFGETAWYKAMPNGDIYIGKVYYKYKGETSDGTKIIIKKGTTGISGKAFYDSYGLTEVVIPDSVKTIGNEAFYSCDNLKTITIPEGITNIGRSAFSGTAWITKQPDGELYLGKVYYAYRGKIPAGEKIKVKEGTTQIASYAFSYTGLSDIEIPESVTDIGDCAFEGCNKLTEISIPKGVMSIGGYAFDDCTGLTSIEIPDNVTNIGKFAFEGCTSLTSISTGNGVTSLSGFEFEKDYDHSQLKSMTIGDNVEYIDDNAFSECNNLEDIKIGSGITKVGKDAFKGTTWYENLPKGDLYIGKVYYEYRGEMPQDTEITIKDDTVTIADNAFFERKELKGVIIPESVTNIGNSAFLKCSNLSNVTLQKNLKNIGEYAFYECGGLSNLTIPDSVTNIGKYAFKGCTGLKNISIGNGVTSLSGFEFEKDYDYNNLSSITIGNKVTNIGNNAFAKCKNLSDITIGKGITSVGKNAFVGTEWYEKQKDGDLYIGKVYYKYKGTMKETAEIAIKEGTIAIEENAFENCTGLKSIKIPESIERIGDKAFSGCTNLEKITIPDSVAKTIGQIFNDTLWYKNQPSGDVYIGKVYYRYKQGSEPPRNMEVIIKSGTVAIAENAFEECTRLVRVNIPYTVTIIGKDAFKTCEKLSAVYYTGTREEWANISIKEGNKTLIKSEIKYKYSG